MKRETRLYALVVYQFQTKIVKIYIRFQIKRLKNETHFCVKLTLYLNPIYTHKKIGTAPQILGTVPVNFGYGTPNYRRVNVSVPKKVWHCCPNFYCTASLFRHRASITSAK